MRFLFVIGVYVAAFLVAANDLFPIHIHHGMDMNPMEIIGFIAVLIGGVAFLVTS